MATKNLEDLYVFVCGMSRDRAKEFVACYESESEILKTLETYKTCKR